METVIEFKDFSFKYRAQKEPTLHDINLKICKGEKVLIIGPSGSGKSTLVNMILKRALAQKLNHNSTKPGKFKSITGYKNIEKISFENSYYRKDIGFDLR